MKSLLNPLFIVSLILFGLHQICQRILFLTNPFLDSYLDDILVMPIVLNLILVERRYLFGLGKNYIFTPLDYILITLVVGGIAEWIFPLFSNEFTFDWFDFLAYGVGTVIFLFVHHFREGVQM